MKTILSISIFFLLSFNSFTQIPGLQWAKNIGGERGLCVRTDAAGKYFITSGNAAFPTIRINKQ